MKKVSREVELKKLLGDPVTKRLAAEMLRLEKELDALSPDKTPHYRRNPKNPAQIKVDPAFYAYHKTLSTYKEIVRVLMKHAENEVEESPLREFLREMHEDV